MKTNDWLRQMEGDLEKVLTEEARKLNFLDGKKIECTLTLKNADYVCESVYSTVLSDKDKKEIFKFVWSDKHREILKLLSQENPKEFGDQENTAWLGNWLPEINTTFRATGLPWRLKKVGKWENCKIYIGTITETDEVFLGRLRYKNDGTILVNSRILFEHKRK
jgi:hypothetical protein